MAAIYPFIPARTLPSIVGAALGPFLACVRTISRALKNRREAGMLAGMDDRMLADIGLTRSDLRDAYAEPLWRDPTDILAGRVRDKRRYRRNQSEEFIVSPSLAPDDGSASAASIRPIRRAI